MLFSIAMQNLYVRNRSRFESMRPLKFWLRRQAPKECTGTWPASMIACTAPVRPLWSPQLLFSCSQEPTGLRDVYCNFRDSASC